MALTPKEVADKQFPTRRIGLGGYREDEVRAFLRRVAATMRGRDTVTPVEVGRVAFAKPRRGELGYAEDEVDAFLDQVVTELSRRQSD